jgi:hypothetical protein
MDKLTLIKALLSEGETSNEYPFEIGGAYFIRTATYHCTGRVVKIIGRFLILEDSAWIADSGRFNEAIKNGTLLEVEPVGNMGVNIESIIDFFEWKHVLPKEVK